MAEPTIAEQQEQWAAVAGQMLHGILKEIPGLDLVKQGEAILVELVGILVGIAMRLTAPIGVGLAKSISSAEDVVAPAFADMAAQGVNDVFGTNVSAGAFRARGRSAGAGDELGRILMGQLRGGGGPIAPSDEAAAKYVNAMATMALEDWFKGWWFEVASSLIPQFDVGKIENYGALGDKVANVLGLGRISRSVLRPLVDAAIVTPFEWQTNKIYQPRLLSPSEAARQVTRGRWDRERGIEELARQGYSAERIEAIFNAQRRFFSAADVRLFVAREHWTRDQGIQHLRDNGYEEESALDALRVEGLRRMDSLEDAEGAAIIAAYADRRITRSEFGGLLNDAISVASERALLTELAELRRTLNVKRLSLSQVEAMVKSGVLAYSDYREAAERDGYPPGDVLALELQLRFEIDKAKTIAEHKAALAAERAEKAAERAAYTAKRRAELEAARALQRRGSEADLEAAVIRGLIPLTRLEEVYRGRYDADTVFLLLDLVEDRRAEYVARQERAALVESGARQRGISVGDARAALFAGLLTVQEFRARLVQLGFSDGDADLLTATAADELEKRQAAERVRRDAADTAARRRIDLSRFETLVRRGARTLVQYDALLADLGFDDVDRAAMLDLLTIKIADDAAARAERERAAGELATRGLSLEQIERAVILGVRTIDDYQRFLIEQRFTPDAQLALVALLRARVDEANAARARREAADAGSGGLALPLTTIRRAARLGVIAPDVYAARLERDGYIAEDIAIDLELLLLEIADVQAARAKREAAELAAAARQLSLSDVEQAVKRGLASIDAYRARAAELGYTGADLELLVDLLVDELAELEAARARRGVIDGELRTRNLSVAQLEEAVKKGLGTLDDFAGELRALGYGDEDAQLLSALLAIDLETAPPASGG